MKQNIVLKYQIFQLGICQYCHKMKFKKMKMKSEEINFPSYTQQKDG